MDTAVDSPDSNHPDLDISDVLDVRDGFHADPGDHQDAAGPVPARRHLELPAVIYQCQRLLGLVRQQRDYHHWGDRLSFILRHAFGIRLCQEAVSWSQLPVLDYSQHPDDTAP